MIDVNELVEKLRAALPKLSNEQRRIVFELVTEDYCRHCGCDDPRCQCWNDE